MDHHHVIEAINKLYDPHSSGNTRLEAGRWLEKFQNSIESWNISVDLYLSGSHDDINTKLFAIQTIKHKVVLDYNQLDESAAVGLKDTLLHQLSTFSSDSPSPSGASMVQLNLALAALAVQMNEALWPDPIGDAIALKAVGLLTFIPEQLVNTSIPMTKDWFNHQRDRLLDLKRIRTVDSLECILGWVKYSTSIDLADMGLLWDYGFQKLDQNPELASELLDELANMEGKIDSPSWFSQFLLPNLENNAELLKKAIKEGDESLIAKLGILYLDIGEVYMEYVMANPSALQLFVQIAIEISETPSLIDSSSTFVIENTFNFWYELQKRITNNTESFIPVFTRLFMSLVKNHLSLPRTDNLEELDSRREFRHVVGDVLKDCVAVIGSTEALLLLCEEIETRGFQEFILFAIRTISSVVDRRESEALPRLFPLLLQSGTSDRRSIVLIIGCYADWLRYHPDHLSSSFSYILESVGHSDNLSCVTALKYLSQSCASLLRKEHLDVILSIRNMVDRRSSFEVIEALGAICLEHVELFDQVIGEIVRSSSSLSSPPQSPLSNEPPSSLSMQNNQIAIMMDQIGVLIESMSGEKQIPVQIIMSFLSTVWPYIQGQISLNDQSVRQSFCLLYRTISRCLSEYLPFEILQELVCRLVDLFRDWQTPMALIALENIIPWHERIPQINSFLDSLRSIQIVNREAYLAWIYLNTCITRFIEPSLVEGSIIKECLSSSIEEECRAAIYHLHYTNQLLPEHLEAIYQGIVGSYPLGLMYDIAILFKQHRHHPHHRELIVEATNQLLDALPLQLFMQREKKIWQEGFIKAMDNPRSKELKEWLMQFSEACKRRLK